MLWVIRPPSATVPRGGQAPPLGEHTLLFPFTKLMREMVSLPLSPIDLPSRHTVCSRLSSALQKAIDLEVFLSNFP
jgi:hypothetical protein